MSRRRRLVLAVVTYALAVLVARLRGWPMGRDVIVRCRQGHLFTTIWIPFASLKALRFGPWRFQRCPVAVHWTFVTPVKESELTPEEIAFAREHKDIRIP
jgi:hypothetical protein